MIIKKRKALALYLLLLQTSTTQCKIPYSFKKINFSVATDLGVEKARAFSKAFLIPLTITTALIFNKTNLLKNFQEYPISSLAISCFACNYFMDTIAKYQQINQALSYFLFAKTFSRYVLTIIAIKNTLTSTKNKNRIIKEQEFLAEVTRNLPLSFSEIDSLALEILVSSINTVNNLQIDINTDITEKVYFLFKENLHIEQVLNLVSDNQELYPHLHDFYLDPHQCIDCITTHMNTLLHESINYIFKINQNLTKQINSAT